MGHYEGMRVKLSSDSAVCGINFQESLDFVFVLDRLIISKAKVARGPQYSLVHGSLQFLAL